MEKDEEGNVHWGDVILESTRNCLVASTDKLVAAIGLEDTVVVETADAILVSSMSAVQQVKKIVEYLKERDRDEFRFHKTVFRQWGSCTLLEAQQRYKISRVVVNPGAGLALQKHYHRFEHWVVVSGTAKITNGKDVFLLEENRSTYVPIGVLHRLENPGTIPLELIEVQIGDYLDDDDVVSYGAEYGVDSKTDEYS
jgi:mannose-1-phosphate guanylyltransferase/mannose-6-phosphate isomerase